MWSTLTIFFLFSLAPFVVGVSANYGDGKWVEAFTCNYYMLPQKKY
jgi:hypothetical protein